MKIVIISDIRGNLAALCAFRESCDEIWVVGNLVNYGPEPGSVIDWVSAHAHLVVRGNHDHAIGFGADSRCSEPYRAMRLPLTAERTIGGQRFFVCHATLFDPLFGYLDKNSEKWESEVASASADIIVVGHTHVPFVRKIGAKTITNPGSLGQPKTGRSDACYAVWENVRLELRHYAYPVERTADLIRSMPITESIKTDLPSVLMTCELSKADRSDAGY